MFTRVLLAAGLVVLSAPSGFAAPAGGQPFALATGPEMAVNCALNADKSRMTVIASNPGSRAYACLVSCRINMAGQRALDPFQCQFVLRAHAAPKVVCTEKGSGPGYFTQVSSARSTCEPR